MHETQRQTRPRSANNNQHKPIGTSNNNLTSTKSRWSASWDAIITVAVALQDGGGDMAVASEGGDEEEDGDAAEACRRHCCWCMLLDRMV
jgi:hypothetical protein